MATLLYRIGRFAARRARLVLTAWLVVLGVVGVGYWFGAGTLSSSVTIPGTATAEVTDRLAAELPGAGGATGNVVLTTADGAAFTDQQRQEISARVAQVATVEGVSGAVDPFATEAERAAQAERLAGGAAQIDQARQEIEAGRAQIDQARQELAAGRAQLDAAREQATAAGMIDQLGPELDAQQAQLEAGAAELEAQQARLEAGAAELDAQEQQLQVASRTMDMAAEIRLVSADGSTAIVPVSFAGSLFEVAEQTQEAVVDAFAQAPVAGVAADFSAELVGGVPEVLGLGEAVGVVIAAVVLVVMLGTLVAAGLPIITALVGVGVGALGALALSGVVEMVSVTPVLGVMLGLAVGIDYSLFIVNRHRRQLADGYDLHESIGLANGTSGNAVVFAGTTVLIALLALNVTGIPFLGLMGTVAAACVAIAVLVAVTLTPALLAMIGPRVLRRRDRAAIGAAGRGTNGTRPAPRPMSTLSAVARVALGVVTLVVVAIPALDLRLGLPDGSSEPADSTAYRAYSTIAEKFGPGQNGPLLVVADLPGGAGEQELLATQVRVAEQIFAHDDVVAVAPLAVSADGDMATFQVVPVDGPTSVSTEELVHDLRAMSPLDGVAPGTGIEIGVAGLASGNIDISEKLADALPAYLAVVVGLSLIILMVVFRSIVVPVIATAGFVLSFFAAVGGVVAIYQWGWLGSVFDVHEPGPILSFLPTLLVGILFGLAMDYMLFLGTGMREAYAHGAPARQAVAQGVRAGRAVVTAAAIIMGSVFGGFVFADSAMIRPIGFALAFGVLLDAFVVRMLVIPAVMHLVGDAAWWLPRWLDRLLPDVDVEGSTLERRRPAAEAETVVAQAG